MYTMKNLTLLLLLFPSMLCFAQKEKKEIVYLLFDTLSKEKCKVDVEGKGYQLLNKYRKEQGRNQSFFYICDESFVFGSKKRKDTCNIKALDNLKIVDIAYIKDKKSKSIMRYNPFKKIYLVEVISKDKIVKYDVLWIDDWTMTRD